MSVSCFLGTDVGGTFTDLVFYTGDGDLHCVKVPSSPAQPGAGVLSGIDELRRTLAAGDPDWRSVAHTHSSTVATNALIERRCARYESGPGPYASDTIGRVLATVGARLAPGKAASTLS